MIIDSLVFDSDIKSKFQNRLEGMHEHSAKTGDCIDTKSAHYGGLHGYAAAIVDFFGEDEARKALAAVVGGSPEQVVLAFGV